MDCNKFKQLSLQFSIFTPVLAFSTGSVFPKLMTDFGDVFDGDPISIPLPPEAPKDIPRIILKSKDFKIKLEVSENRVNLSRYFNIDETNEISAFVSFIELWGKLTGSYMDFTNATVGRLAVVAVKACECDNPGKALAEHFCKPEYLVEPFNRPESFEIHSHKKYKFGAFSVNSWVRCKTGKLKKENKPIIIIEQDLNTLAEAINESKFSKEEIITFTREGLKEQQIILKKYFPR
jgi:hypothetical protein